MEVRLEQFTRLQKFSIQVLLVLGIFLWAVFLTLMCRAVYQHFLDLINYVR